MILYCLRHGESTYNAERRIQGQLNIGLSPLGKQQSLAAGNALAGLPIQAIFSSPLLRALETAQIIADVIKVPVISEPLLMEIHAGIFQGKTWEEIDRVHPDEAARWRKHDPDFVIPGGESRRALMQRGRKAFEKIREAGHRQVVVVSHGGLLSGAFKALLEIPAERNPFEFFNASINKTAWDAQFQLLTLNQAAHLREAGLSMGGDL